MTPYKLGVGALFILIVAAVGWLLFRNAEPLQVHLEPVVTSFEECAAAGYPVMESYPRQCRDAYDTVFIETVAIPFPISYTNATPNDITVNNLSEENNVISSPLTVTGEARGWWFFEASFPVVLTDWDGLIIAEGYATAGSEWMTTELVPFTFTLNFTTPPGNGSEINRGTLILKRDNPSDLPENDAALEIPVVFE